MREYESPKAEMIEFEQEMVMGQSGCNCQYWQTTNNELYDEEADDYYWAPGCEGRSAHASENTMNVPAPNWIV